MPRDRSRLPDLPARLERSARFIDGGAAWVRAWPAPLARSLTLSASGKYEEPLSLPKEAFHQFIQTEMLI